MRQGVVITLIVVGALLLAAPLVVGCYEYVAIAVAVNMDKGGNVSLTVPWLDVYVWACFAAGLAMVALALMGEWNTKRPLAREGISTQVS